MSQLIAILVLSVAMAMMSVFFVDVFGQTVDFCSDGISNCTHCNIVMNEVVAKKPFATVDVLNQSKFY
jgi:hypothetical protein